ncbi:MAG TPA: DUF4010 domain-containing protein, partial [Bryobacteraceae bacterium]|nr:DUF4010 domain-containing protein [Bryobacteraceae bacterium]
MAAPGTFSPLEISIKLALAIAIGMLVGLEREWSQKDLGTRTFAITAMVGALSVLAGPAFAYVSFAGILLIVFLAGIRNVYDRKPVEATTSVAVILTFVLGVLVGEGHHYTPIAAVVIMTMLLSLKPALTHFAGGLQVNEVRSAVLLGLLAFVIFPVLPNRTVDPWQLINPREAWLTVIVIAALGFVNYVLLKLYSSRGLYYTAVLGGMINSTATIAELAEFLTSPISDLIPLAIVVDFLTIIAMFVRNLLILAFFAPAAVLTAAAPLLVMALAALFFIWRQRGHRRNQIGELKLSSPLSLLKVLKFGLIFLIIQIVGSLGQRYLGHFGFLLVSFIGGLISSASTAGAAATLAMRGSISPETAGMATVLTSMASALSNLPLVHHQVREWGLTRKLGSLSF